MYLTPLRMATLNTRMEQCTNQWLPTTVTMDMN